MESIYFLRTTSQCPNIDEMGRLHLVGRKLGSKNQSTKRNPMTTPSTNSKRSLLNAIYLPSWPSNYTPNNTRRYPPPLSLPGVRSVVLPVRCNRQLPYTSFWQQELEEALLPSAGCTCMTRGPGPGSPQYVLDLLYLILSYRTQAWICCGHP